MPYQAIQTLTFPVTPEAIGFDNFVYKTLKFPQKWNDIIAEINGKENRKYLTQTKRIHLEELLKSFFPELVSINSYFWYDSWLYCIEEIPALKIRQLVNAWFWANNRRTLDKFSYIADRVDEIIQPREAEDELKWENKTINLAEIKTNNWNTAEFINNESYKLLPELLARSLTKNDVNGLRRTLPFGGHNLKFLHTSPLEKGVELISWSPLSFKGDYYSVLINFCLQLVPFQPFPNIAVNLGVRRWVSVKKEGHERDKLGGGNHSAYLLSKLDGKCPVENGFRFQHTSVKKGGERENYRLKYINAFEELYKEFFGESYLPDLVEFAKNPVDFINQDKTKMLLVFDNRMFHNHKVYPGLSAEDKGSLFGVIIDYFKNDFNLLPSAPVSRCELKRSNRNLIGFSKFYEKDSSGNEFSKNEIFFGTKPRKERDKERLPKLDEEQMKALCHKRREYLAKNVGQKFQLEVWWQNDFVRDEILKQISNTLGLKNFDMEKDNNGERNIWRTPEIEIEIIVKDLENLGDAIVFDENAVSELQENGFYRRVEEIQRTISKSDTPIPAIVEVKDKKEFKPIYNQTTKFSFDTDPKSAMRIGFARCGRLTQFINSPHDTTSQDALPSAANSSFLDSLRQIGLVGGLPTGTSKEVAWVNSINFAAVWMLKKKEKGFSKVLPIIVFIRRNEEKDQVFATANGLNEFLPYQEFLLKLAVASNIGWLNDWKNGSWTESRKRGEEDVRKFLQNRLSRLTKLGELAVFVKSQNSKNNWAWLMDKNLSNQNLSFDSCQNFEDLGNWENLRVVRLRTTTGDEVPQHIVPNIETHSYGNSAGIFKLNDHVFYGAAGKSVTMKDASQKKSKVENAKALVWNANLVEIIPCFLQSEDSPEEFAHLTHILRDAGVNFSDEYQLPLPLHLGELTKEFIPDFALEETESE
jgi:hypothetical protein